jgi:adenine-specific DNA-methyltransferase
MKILEAESLVEEPQIVLWGENNTNTQTVVVENTLEEITIEKEKVTKTSPISLESRRYIGNKNKLLTWIFDTIAQNTQDAHIFFDLFAGTGTVGKFAMQTYQKVILNDILYSNEIIYKAFFQVSEWDKTKIENIINSYNNLDTNTLEDNYFSINFGGKFFDNANAKLIGYVREDIEYKKSSLTEKEYCILLAILIYNMDKIANTVGHFDAYIKKPIRKQKLQFRLLELVDFQAIEIHRNNANELVRKIKTDIAYIDPPYNSRQYSRFYHIYENLVKWEKPELSGVALKPPTENMSVYCTTKANQAFADLVENLDAKYLVVSYNNTYNSKSNSSENKIKLEEIETILKNKGETQVFECSHKFFNTGKTEFNNHKEYLFITKTKKTELKPNKIYRSPLFYVGDKFKILPQIKTYFPEKINRFIEPFMGGGSVFLNVEAKEFFLNDIDKSVVSLHQFLQESAQNPTTFFQEIEHLIDKYGLSKSYKEDVVPAELKQQFAKTYYAKFNKNAFQTLKEDFNKNQSKTILLYLLLIYGFNRMIRFNSKGAYNLPVGNVDFNKNVVEALQDYFSWLQGKQVKMSNLDYVEFIKGITIEKDDFVYIDPPYLITFSEYNKLWNEDKEQEMTQFLDTLYAKNIRFAVSNVTHYKGKENTTFLQWAQKYNVYPIKSNYISYHDNSIKNFQEVLVTNYEKES